MTVIVKRGMRIVFKPEWRSPGDDAWTYVAVTDAHSDGDFYTSTLENTMWIRPQSPARADMVESAEPLLPVFAITFVALERKGARCRMRRTLGERELSVTEEVVPRSTFRQLFDRRAAHCKPGDELQRGVEWPLSLKEGTRHAESKG